MGRIAVGVLALLVGGFVLGACGSSSSGGLPSGVTLSRFEASNLHQARARGADGFDVPSARSVSCIMPTSWQPGKTATCYVYDKSGVELGTITDTALPTQGSNAANWNAHWMPSASYAATSTTTLPPPTGTTLVVPKTIFSQSGTGNASTGSFTVPSGAAEWDVDWSYNCANFGQPGSFMYQVSTATALDFSDVGPSPSGMSGSATAHYYDTGTFHFTTISECDWTIEVVLP